MKVLRGLGVEERLRRVAFAPRSHLNRVWDTGEVTNELPMPERLYGAPYLCMHRATLHDALAVGGAGGGRPARQEARRARAAAPARSTLAFADGTRVRADAVVGADGVHSTVRELLLGPEKLDVERPRGLPRGVPRGTGRARPRSLAHEVVGHRPPYRHLLHDRRRATRSTSSPACPEPLEWMTRESWSAKGDVRELRAAYAGFHPDVRAVLDGCPDCHKWAILERAAARRAGATAASCCSATPAIR